MSSGLSLENIVDVTFERLGGRIPKDEIRRSMATVAGRWYSVLSIGEKWDVATMIGGNRYTATTFEILNALFSEIIEEMKGE